MPDTNSAAETALPEYADGRFTPRGYSTTDEVIARVGEPVAHIPVEDAYGNVWTACGEFTHDMPRRLLMDALEPDWRCPACFPDPTTRYPRFVCSRCGDLVSTRPEKAENRVPRPEGGWDHFRICGTSAARVTPSGQPHICYCPERGDNYHSSGAPGCVSDPAISSG